MSQGDQRHLSLKRNVLWNTAGSVFYQGCLWLMTVLVVRLSADYQNSGMLAFAMSIGNIYNALGTYNMRTYQVSDVTGLYSASNYVGLRIVTVTLGMAICGVYAIVVAQSPATLWVILAFLLFKADEAFVNVLYGCDQVAMRLDYVGISQIFRGIIVVALFVVGMLVSESLVLTLLFVFIGCVAVTLLYDLPRSRTVTNDISPSISRSQCLALLRQCLPTVAGSVIGGLVVSTARQYFGIAYGEEALGIYASVATPCVIIQVLAQNLYTPMLGPIAGHHRSGDTDAARRDTIRLLLLVVGVALGISLVFSLVAEPLLTLIYGPSIVPYINVLPLAMVVMTGVAAMALVSDLLIVFGHLRTTLLANGIALVVCMALVVPCTQAWYMNGLNIALIVAYVIAVMFGVSRVLRYASQPWEGAGKEAQNGGDAPTGL